LRAELHQIPQVTVKIGEDGNFAIILSRRRADPFDPGGGEGGEVPREIIGGKERRREALMG